MDLITRAHVFSKNTRMPSSPGEPRDRGTPHCSRPSYRGGGGGWRRFKVEASLPPRRGSGGTAPRGGNPTGLAAVPGQRRTRLARGPHSTTLPRAAPAGKRAAQVGPLRRTPGAPPRTGVRPAPTADGGSQCRAAYFGRRWQHQVCLTLTHDRGKPEGTPAVQDRGQPPAGPDRPERARGRLCALGHPGSQLFRRLTRLRDCRKCGFQKDGISG